METIQTSNTQPNLDLDFKTVWAALMEDREQLKELREAQRESARLWNKASRKINAVGKQIGYLHRSFGELAEHLVAPGIAARFNERGFHFDAVSPGGLKILDEKGKTKTQIDLLLENSKYIIAIEVKSKPKVQDIEHNLVRLKILREYRNKHGDSRKIYGAVAGAIFGEMEKQAVLEAGMFVLEQSGDTMKLDVPTNFVPREW